MQVVEPHAISLAVEAEAQANVRRDQVRAALVRDLEAARYSADRAFRQYDSVDPENRLIAAELEVRWNRALTRVSEIETRIAEHDASTSPKSPLLATDLSTLTEDLTAVWSAPTTNARLKKRIVRTIIHEVIADIDYDSAEIVGLAESIRSFVCHARVVDSAVVPQLIPSQLVLVADDDLIAGILNRNGLITGMAIVGHES